jgi:curved DNA-binding protein CbpA
VATHYEVLGVEPGASPAAVRAAYLAKARVLHPDRQVGRSRAEVATAQRRMQDVNAAWSVLGDPRSRRSYDLSLRPPMATSSTASGPTARPAGPARPARPARPPVVLDDEPGGQALPFLVRVGPVVLLLGILLTIFVMSAFVAGGGLVDPRNYGSVDRDVPEVGSCINLRSANPTDCDLPDALPIEEVVAPPDRCDEGAVPIWWEEDAQLCVRPES